MNESGSPQCLKAALLWDGICSTWIENAYLIWDQGIITEITKTPVAGAVDLGNAAIIPPVVNAHAHLEFSHLHQPITPAIPFTGWIGKTIAQRRENENPQQSLDLGINETEKSGVALLGEIVTHSQLDYPANQTDLSMVLFRELIGLTAQTVREQKEVVSDFLDRYLAEHPLGLSPHAPYTVRPELLQQCIEWACQFNLPVTMHLAETPAELELMKSGTGEIVQMLERLELWDSQMIETGTRPLDYLRKLSQAPGTLLAHCNYLCDEEIEFLAHEPQFSVIYCPRTHAFFQHSKHPWQRMIDAGVNVALGTDGRGSSPDLDLWKEVQFLGRNYPAGEAERILRMATVNGWRACRDHVSIEVGQRARWTVIRTQSKSCSRFVDWSDLIGPETRIETVNHSGPWLPRWWQDSQERFRCAR